MTSAHAVRQPGGVRRDEAGRRRRASHRCRRRPSEATRSHKRLFPWHIAINDADNGVYLPKYKSTVVETLPKAIKHAGLHTTLYQLEVFARLRLVPAEFANREDGRKSLKTIKKELLDGTFPYRKEDQA